MSRRAHRAYADEAPRRVEGLTRDEVCERFKHKVSLLARRVYERLSSDASVTVDDLASVGAIGLLEAFERFDPGRGITFSTFAEYRIRGAMYDNLRTHDTFTRRRRQLAKKIADATETMRRRVDRIPTPLEIAEHLEITLEAYWLALDRVKPITHVSIDARSDDDDGRPLIERLMDHSTTGPETGLIVAEVKYHLKEAIKALPERQRQCVLMYYGKDMSLAEIAQVYGVTVSRISQILSEARERLRKKLLPVVDGNDLALGRHR